MRPPNVLLMNCDDLGYGDLGCYGSERNDTPTLDRLATEGMRFTDFYQASAVCGRRAPLRSSHNSAPSPTRLGTNWATA